MLLMTVEPVEFRRSTSNVSKADSSKTNYYYTFEDDKGSFQVFSRSNFDELKKGDMVNLIYESRLWDNKLQFDLKEVSRIG